MTLTLITYVLAGRKSRPSISPPRAVRGSRATRAAGVGRLLDRPGCGRAGHDQIATDSGRTMGSRDLRPAMTVARRVGVNEDWYNTNSHIV